MAFAKIPFPTTHARGSQPIIRIHVTTPPFHHTNLYLTPSNFNPRPHVAAHQAVQERDGIDNDHPVAERKVGLGNVAGRPLLRSGEKTSCALFRGSPT